MQSFNWQLFDRSFDEMVPWLGGAFYDWKTRCLLLSTVDGHVPEYEVPETHHHGQIKPEYLAPEPPSRVRLLELEEGDGFCLYETDVGPNADGHPKILSRSSDTPLFTFQYITEKDGSPITHFSVRTWWFRSRGVTAYRDLDGDGSWQFEENGNPESFEDQDQYLARHIQDRLTREMLITYVSRAFDANINRLITRNFHRVAEISSDPIGMSLSGFEPYFRKLKTG